MSLDSARATASSTTNSAPALAYCDWVVDAPNRDMPFDEFTRLQLAGDVIHPMIRRRHCYRLSSPRYDTVGQQQQSCNHARVRQDELEPRRHRRPGVSRPHH